MNLSRKCIATKLAASLALLLGSHLAIAEPAGVVSDLTGPLLAKTASGSIKVLAAGSSVEPLDTLISRPGVYARVTLTDHSDLALGPDTELAIESYSFHDKSSEANTAVLRLNKGSVRVTSGALGARDTDTYTLAAGATTIAIHHSTFIATYKEDAKSEIARRATIDAIRLSALVRTASNHTYLRVTSYPTHPAQPLELSDSPLRLAQSFPVGPSVGTPPPGLYVQVLDGLINVTNPAGSQNFAAGQFGFTPSFQQPPVILPANPGLKFTPPPAFNAPTSQSPSSSSGSKSNAVDCEVR